MIFRKDIEPRCVYCKHAQDLDEEHVACPRKGIMPAGSHCRGFSYDALKRTPPEHAVPNFSKYSDEDFTL